MTDDLQMPTAVSLSPSHRADLLIFEIVARLTSGDMRWMADRVRQAFERENQVDILILFRPFEGATAGAAFEPEALKVEAASIAHVRRYGVVGAPAWADAMINLGGALSPIDARTFDRDEEAEARAWIA